MCLFMAGFLEIERRPGRASGHDRRLGKHVSGHDLVLILRSLVRHVAANRNRKKSCHFVLLSVWYRVLKI